MTQSLGSYSNAVNALTTISTDASLLRKFIKNVCQHNLFDFHEGFFPLTLGHDILHAATRNYNNNLMDVGPVFFHV